MGLIKRRPRIRVRLPRVVQPGSECTAEVTLDAARPVPIEALDVTLTGVETVRWGESRDSLTLLSLGAKLSGPRQLPRGETRFSCRFALPDSLPPTYSGNSASTAYTINVHADIPWWPDARGAFVVHVERPPPPVDAQPEPKVFSSNPAGPIGTDPYVELSLADRIVPSGGVIVGKIALSNVQHNAYTGVTLELVPVEIVRIGAATSESRGTPHRSHLMIRDPSEGGAIPFRMRMPELAPSNASRLWRLDWRLCARVERRYGRDLAIDVPIVVVPEGAREAPKSTRAAPTLGSERVEGVWRSVASALGLTLSGEALVGAEAQTKLRVWREHLGRAGLRLFGELEYPSLNLDLDGGPASGLRRLVGGEAPGASRWEKRHRVTGRDRAQVLAVWRELFWPLIKRDELYPIVMVSLSDQRLRLELPDAGQNAPPLHLIARTTVLLAQLMAHARAAIPPPAAMTSSVDAWRALAQSLGGTLETARMAIACELSGQSAEIVTVWDAGGDARHTEVTLSAVPPLPIRWTLEWSESAGVTSGDLDSLSRSACEVFVQLEGSCAAVSIASDRLVAMLPAPLADPDPARAALLRLSELADALRSRAGAYR